MREIISALVKQKLWSFQFKVLGNFHFKVCLFLRSLSTDRLFGYGCKSSSRFQCDYRRFVFSTNIFNYLLCPSDFKAYIRYFLKRSLSDPSQTEIAQFHLGRKMIQICLKTALTYLQILHRTSLKENTKCSLIKFEECITMFLKNLVQNVKLFD